MKNHRLSLADVLDDCLMYMCIGMVALGVLTGEAHCQTLPEAHTGGRLCHAVKVG
jgi:hypothetical protein